MFLKMLAAVCLVCVTFVNAGLIPQHARAVIVHPATVEEGDPHYEFQYSVHDAHTGDIKDQFEHRRGDYVTGRYSLIEPDGQRRVVEYSADPLSGFTAEVRREGPVIRSYTIAHPKPVAAAERVELWPAPVQRH